MDEFILASGHSKLAFHSPRFNSDGFITYYVLTAMAPGFNASLEVDVSCGVGTSPADFLAEIAEAWRGWEGVKTWETIEGEFELSASSDSAGHYFLKVRMKGGGWSAALAFEVDAGEIEFFSKQAKAFFECRTSSPKF